MAKCKDSLLTTSSGYTNYRGILNLVIILLILSNARSALENLIKYGLLVDPISWIEFFRDGSRHWPAIVVGLTLVVHILVALVLELLLAAPYFNSNHHPHHDHQQQQNLSTNNPSKKEFVRNEAKLSRGNENMSPTSKRRLRLQMASKQFTSRVSNSSPTIKLATLAANCLLIINLIAVISLPPIILFFCPSHPISASAALMLASIILLKLVSYHMMNFWARDVRRHSKHQARTTRSFLKTYVPAALEFENHMSAGKEPNPSTATQTTPIIKTPPTPASTPSQSPNTTPSTTTQTQLSNTTTPDFKEAAAKNKYRELRESMSVDLLLDAYPANLTLANMIDFIAVPTLCYELEYARTTHIRKQFLIKRIVELVILSQVDMALVQQWIVPTVENSLLPFRQMNFSLCVERLLKLAIPNHIIWLIWFYLFFHSLLNIIAELTQFADREFYRDWWNSESVQYFWSNWNIPVHKWCVRHLYVPLIALGLTKCQASTAVFFVSAFFHEYLVSVPLKMFRMWAFMGMLMQLPLARFVSAYFNSSFANVAVWLSLIIGQPLCILMYYHDYYIINYRINDT